MSVASRAINKKRPTTCLRRHSRFRGEDRGLIPQKRFGLFAPNDKKIRGAFGGKPRVKRAADKKEKEALLRRSKN